MADQLQRVNIHDVARTAGVSAATVSKVINRRHGVAQATSQRVQQVIDELGYESSLVARSLRSHRTNVIGILVAEFEPFSTEILKGVSQAIGGTGYELLAYSGGDRAGALVGWERRSLSRLSGTLIDGAILVTPSVVDSGGSVPVVAIDPHAGPSDLPTVDSDNFTGAVRRDGAPAGARAPPHRLPRRAPDLESSRLREEGYRAALAAAGVAVDPELMRVGGYRRETTQGPARELLSLPERPTAIFAGNDLSAIATMEVARELGLTIPDDLSVIGFDNVPESAMTSPAADHDQPADPADGVRGTQPAHPPHGRTAERSTHVRLPTELIVRASTAPPSALEAAKA